MILAMPTGSVRPSPAVSNLLRERRTALRLTISEVARRLAAQGSPIPHSTLVRIEQGKLDPGIRRLHQILRLYEIPAHVVADYVELEELASGEPIEGDNEVLYQRAIELWRSGDLKGGLARFVALRRRLTGEHVDRVARRRATLGFAIAARDLGKFQLAKTLVDEVLVDDPPPDIALKAFTLAASIWVGLGSRDVAFAFLREAAARVGPKDHENAAYVAHQEAKLLLALGRHDEALAALGRAVDRYRAHRDTYGQARAGILRIRIVEAAGRTQDAVDLARASIKLTTRHGYTKLTLTGQLELGRLLALSGRIPEALELLRKALGQAVLIEDRNARFLAHHHLWKAYAAAGDRASAAVELTAAQSLARYVDDLSEEADEVRAFAKSGGTHNV